ncbi:YdjY domain-containing protein [Rubinisphaera sp.]|uniref:YdjY domain-containing protein n=1 Tax=Rubinisphaera sp. TaxID=2024857 RepID=UPI000C101FA9|nr:YdjY domain-containing protein [Rubinisphaera sp.]MBV08529.1 hypothetical protein [Rubinisphaera sp.]HCS50858.1 hypothetical protein [Planctomycetaceae bacterium]|tara:strand:- start:12342 stop:13298 length:957 start_codon:yes stop_codon:yes gene_type:complete
MISRISCLLITILLMSVVAMWVTADEKATSEDQTATPPALPEKLQKLLKQATPLNPQETLFLDRPAKAIYLKATVALQEGLLEMLCCPEQTKEHESILATNCSATPIHTALLALGAQSGEPVSFDPVFNAPTGEVLAITILWKADDGTVREQDSHEWIQTVTRRYFTAPLVTLPAGLTLPEDSDLMYDKTNQELLHFGTMSAEEEKMHLTLSNDPAFQKAIRELQKSSQPSLLEADWVFAGSIIDVDPTTGQKRYLADGGDLICVANFPSAMIDIAIKSSASDGQRGYEANPQTVPAPGTPVVIKIQRQKDVAVKQAN